MKICYFSIGDNIHDIRTLKYLVKRYKDDEIILLTYTNISVKLKKIYNKLKIKLILLNSYIPINNKFQLYVKIGLTTLAFPLIIRHIKPNIVISAQIFPFGLICALSGFNPLIHIGWGSDILKIPSNILFKQFCKFSLKRGNLIIVNSENLKKGLANILPGILTKKSNNYRSLLYWNWGMEYLLDYKTDLQNRNKIRDQLGWAENNIVISNRWLNPIYRVEKLIKIVPNIKELNPNCRFLIIGDGIQLIEFKKFVRTNKLTKYVKFLGRIEHSKMLGFLDASDIFVSVSSSDSQSYALIEALYLGKPCIISELPGYLELVQNDRNGIIIDPDNKIEFQEAILKLSNSEEIVTKFQKYNRENIVPLMKRRINDRIFTKVVQFLIKNS